MSFEHPLSISALARPPGVAAAEVAVRFGDIRVTYGELEGRSSRVARSLLAAGVQPDQRVVFVGRNGVECLELLLGASKVGVVPAFLNWRLHAAELAPLIDDCAPPLIFADEEFADAVRAAVADSPQQPDIIVIGASQGASAFPAWRDQFPAEVDEWDEDPADTAAQLYTSGTTGRPKGAMLTRAGFAAALPDAVGFWGIGPGSAVLSVLPIYHIAGLGLAVGTLWAGGTLVISNDASADATLAAIENYRVTHLVLASMMLKALVSAPAFASADVSSLQTVSYGAAPISPAELRQVVERMSCRVVQPYGLTETTGVLTLLDDRDHRRAGEDPELAPRLASCGRARPGVELRIVDPSTGEDVAPGASGEIWVRSDRVMSGYWNLPAESAEVLLDDGWFRTGDVACVDAEGYVTLKDRLKDVIISGGENVYPQEVEAVLQSHPDVADVAVVGAPHEKWGETPVAVVVAAARVEPDSEALIAFARARLAHYKCPSAILITEELPRNATGKVLRKVLRQQIPGNTSANR